MNAMAHGDVNTAIESLHAYFDGALPSEAPSQGLLPHASLSLARLYLQCGQLDDGLQLMYETIYLAQESKDEVRGPMR